MKENETNQFLAVSFLLATFPIIEYIDVTAITGGTQMASITVRNIDESLGNIPGT
ncbi:MAG: hypothetical protein ACOYL3_17660 [Desulfuromonadaceae bacterium]